MKVNTQHPNIKPNTLAGSGVYHEPEWVFSFARIRKYRRAVIDEHVDGEVKEACLATEKLYEIKYLEIGSDKDHIHLLVQSVPT